MADDTKTDESTDLATLGEIQGTLQRPKSLGFEDRTGADNIRLDEIQLPRLTIAQGLSPQMTPGDAQHIEGLTLFDMFNDLTEEIYGKGPLTFVPVRRDVRHIEFRPRKEGGGIIDMDVPFGDPRLDWGEPDASGKKEPPKATTFHEFVVLLLRKGRRPESIVLSVKDTNKHNRRAWRQLTSHIAFFEAPIYAGMYTVDTKKPAKNDQGTWGVPTIKSAGFIPKDTPQGQSLFAYAERFYKSLEGMTIVVEREAPTEEETSFDTERMDNSAPAEQETVETDM